MTKRKKKTVSGDDIGVAEARAAAELGSREEYQKYLKENAKRLRELERIASGRNMVEPW